MVCESCSAAGRSSRNDAKFCCHCGRPLTQATWTQPMWAQTTARLVRPREHRVLGGVCAGIAAAYGWDVVLVRIIAVVLLCSGVGTLGIVYIAAWIIMPNAPLMYVAPNAPMGYGGSAPVA